MLLNKDKIHFIGNLIIMKNFELRKLYEKLAMTLQFDLTRFYDVIIDNLVFQLGFLIREFQIP